MSSATLEDTEPDIPVSISSKIIEDNCVKLDKIDFIESITLDISPPEAISFNSLYKALAFDLNKNLPSLIPFL